MNPVHRLQYIILDCDSQHHLSAHLPTPNWSCINASTGHAQYGYVLKDPVHTGPAALTKPQQFYRSITTALIARASADPKGTWNAIKRNPTRPGRSYLTWWGRKDPYSLKELADNLRIELLEQRTATNYSTPLPNRAWAGRNDCLFRLGRQEARRLNLTDQSAIMDRIKRRQDRYIENAETLFDTGALPDKELTHISKSIAKYQRNGDRPTLNDPGKAARTARSRRGGLAVQRLYKARNAPRNKIIHDLFKRHTPVVEIAAICSLSVRTIYRIIEAAKKSSPPPVTPAKTVPRDPQKKRKALRDLKPGSPLPGPANSPDHTKRKPATTRSKRSYSHHRRHGLPASTPLPQFSPQDPFITHTKPNEATEFYATRNPVKTQNASVYTIHRALPELTGFCLPNSHGSLSTALTLLTNAGFNPDSTAMRAHIIPLIRTFCSKCQETLTKAIINLPSQGP